MYFPYFRGRQYELIALKELVKGGLLSNLVIPVIEPVKLARRENKFIVPYKMIPTFDVTIKAFIDAKHQVAIVGNPEVGDLSRISGVKGLMGSYLVANEIIPSVLINKSAGDRISELSESGIEKNRILTIFDNRDSLSVYTAEFDDSPPRYTLFSSDERQIRRAVKQNKVLFKDWFRKQVKNADYAIEDDEPFSEDHLYFNEEGYDGFGDYSIVGNIFDESGFTPKAVAIHIVYFADDRALRVHHFVSDSNIDIKDVAGKYYEAVAKLVNWFNNGYQNQRTTGLSELINHYENGYYPGLPTIKKLSIMHHLELMGKYLDGGMVK
jgi:hypothetical protein